jgi:thiosulfate/3-mercaptopyruvate sulfurtransferase
MRLQMFSPRISQRRSLTGILAVTALVLFIRVLGGAPLPDGGDEQTNPWSTSEVVQPADLARELGKGLKPQIVCVGVEALYREAHISGSAYLGPASKPQGLEELKKWAKGIPRGQRIVLYCGCCPMDRCPNIRPAFQALKEMGFTHLQVLSIPQDLGRDWVSKGFPTEKAK